MKTVPLHRLIYTNMQCEYLVCTEPVPVVPIAYGACRQQLPSFVPKEMCKENNTYVIYEFHPFGRWMKISSFRSSNIFFSFAEVTEQQVDGHFYVSFDNFCW